MAATKQIIASAGVATSLLMLGAVGCQSTIGERMNGSYEGYQPVQTQPGTDPVITHQLGVVRIVAHPDGMAELVDQGIPVHGHIEYGPKEATFVPENFVGLLGNGGADSSKVDQYRAVLKPLPTGHWLFGGQIDLAPSQTKPG